MPHTSNILIDPKNFFVVTSVEINPAPVAEPPPISFDRQSVKTMTVANGSVIQVYDVTDPSNPVLTGTIG